jgi:RNA polymerase sigma-70 factor (ECF subfamily)
LLADVKLEKSLTVDDLYAEYRDGLQRYAASLTHDAARADDLVQETFIASLSHLELLSRLNPHQRKAWLCQVLKNRFLDQLRAYRRRQALLETLARQALLDDAPGFGAPLYSAALPYELFDLVPFRYRDLLRKRYILGMSSEEISRDLGVPPATVRSRLRLAIKWLRAHKSEFV